VNLNDLPDAQTERNAYQLIDGLLSTWKTSEYPMLPIARAMMSRAAVVYMQAKGREEVAKFLRDLADNIEGGSPTAAGKV
jgi:replication-associated recombination protein RarA